jgi:hypothetical protein
MTLLIDAGREEGFTAREIVSDPLAFVLFRCWHRHGQNTSVEPTSFGPTAAHDGPPKGVSSVARCCSRAVKGGGRAQPVAEFVAAIDSLSLAPYKLEAYNKKTAIRDEEQHKFEQGREEGLVDIFKTRFLKRLESSIEGDPLPGTGRGGRLSRRQRGR